MKLRKLVAGALVAGVLATPALVFAQVDSPTATSASRDADDNSEWGWLGLLGLLGLMGLKRRDRVDVAATATAPRRTA